MLLGRAVAAQLDRRHPEREQSPGLVAQCIGQRGGRRAGEVRLDDRHLAARSQIIDCGGRERRHRREVGDRRREVRGRVEHGVERGADGEHERVALATLADDGHLLDGPGLGVGLAVRRT
jgi:hypothetical protein